MTVQTDHDDTFIALLEHLLPVCMHSCSFIIDHGGVGLRCVTSTLVHAWRMSSSLNILKIPITRDAIGHAPGHAELNHPRWLAARCLGRAIAACGWFLNGGQPFVH